MGMDDRPHGCTENGTLTERPIQIIKRLQLCSSGCATLEPWKAMATDMEDGRGMSAHQSWRNRFSTILTTTAQVAQGKWPADMVSVKRQYCVSSTTTTTIPITWNGFRAYHERTYLHGKGFVAGFCTRPPPFLTSVLFTDEATFTRVGVINLHNRHTWARKNPHARVESSHQHRFSINVWAGCIGDYLLGPVVLPRRLTGQTYLDFLQNMLPLLLEDVPLGLRQAMWLMHDGAPAHFSINVRRHLNTTFPGRWIERGDPVAWPARSPDLNPLDFWFWGHLKSIVYAEPVPDVQTLERRVIAATNDIRGQVGTLERVRQSLMRRVGACIASHGGHFEHLL